MVTRSAWHRSVLEAWRGEPCPRCGRELRPEMVDEHGDVWGWCGWDDVTIVIANEPIPHRFDPEPIDADDIPF